MTTTTSRWSISPELFHPDWPAPTNVRAIQTCRQGGVSVGPYGSFNLGEHVGDDPVAVAANRAALASRLPSLPYWLNQVHGTAVAQVDEVGASLVPDADASVSRRSGQVCVVMTADCLPVLFCDDAGTVVAAAHAGWRGLQAGILERTIETMQVAPSGVLAWLGPAIGPGAFEVGPEVREAFVRVDRSAEVAFVPVAAGKFLADIYLLARLRLNAAGVSRISGGDHCTVNDTDRFFSYRRDGRTGRMASLIWLD